MLGVSRVTLATQGCGCVARSGRLCAAWEARAAVAGFVHQANSVGQCNVGWGSWELWGLGLHCYCWHFQGGLVLNVESHHLLKNKTNQPTKQKYCWLNRTCLMAASGLLSVTPLNPHMGAPEISSPSSSQGESLQSHLTHHPSLQGDNPEVFLQYWQERQTVLSCLHIPGVSSPFPLSLSPPPPPYCFK